jgi:hypothetical protein
VTNFHLKIKLKDFLDVCSLRKAVILSHEVSQREVSINTRLFGQEDGVVEFKQLVAAKSL